MRSEMNFQTWANKVLLLQKQTKRAVEPLRQWETAITGALAPLRFKMQTPGIKRHPHFDSNVEKISRSIPLLKGEDAVDKLDRVFTILIDLDFDSGEHPLFIVEGLLSVAGQEGTPGSSHRGLE